MTLTALTRRRVLGAAAGAATMALVGCDNSSPNLGERKIEKPKGHPNVLLVTGNLYHATDTDHVDPRDLLHKFLTGQLRDDPSASPVRAGTHDFWCIFTLPNAAVPNGGNGYAKFDQLPVPLRSIPLNGKPPEAVIGGKVPTAADSGPLGAIADSLRTMMEEVGHHWLVHPNHLTFTIGGREQEIDVNDFVHISKDEPFTGPLFIGRDAVHWSSYFLGDSSPFDGVTWNQGMHEGRLDRWTCAPLVKRPVQPPARPGIASASIYNDLDLIVMGVKDPADAYPARNHRLYWMEPWFISPMNYMAGIFVAFSQQDFVYFGFDQDHRYVGVSRTNKPTLNRERLGSRYQVWAAVPTNTYGVPTGVALRVVRSGNTMYFQARLDGSLLAPAWGSDGNQYFLDPPPAVPNMFEGVPALGGKPTAPASGPDFFGGFRTVATVDVLNQPLAVGLITKAADAYWVDAVYSHLELLQPGASAPVLMPVNDQLPRLATDTYTGLPQGAHLHVPVDPPARIVLPMRNRLRLRLPGYAEDWPDGSQPPAPAEVQPPYDHAVTAQGFIDRAPKVVIPAPHGDFAFGAPVALRRTVFHRSAGGCAPNTEMLGIERSMLTTDVHVNTQFERQPPPDTGYKVAFILCAPGRNDIKEDHIASLDLLREYWDTAFETNTGRKSNSMLDWPAS